jgi:hypothetical protein
VKYVMSLCHIWFGVERSNRRGGGFVFLRTGLLPAARSTAFRCWRTVSGLALRKKNRRRICEIRFTPCRGSCCFSSVIFAWTATGSFGPVRCGTGPFSPASPYFR